MKEYKILIENSKQKRRNIIRLIFFIFFLIIIINTVSLSVSNYTIEDIYNSNYSYITLKVNKTGRIDLYSNYGYCRIYWDEFQSFPPEEVYINGEKQDYLTGRYHINNIETNATLVWKNNKINSTQCLFYGCSDILEIDLFHFNITNIAKMEGMFYECSKLISININNIDTSNVINMNEMFYGCSSLEYLDLSNFNTSQVKFMYNMFDGCSSLKSLDLSNFDFSHVTDMEEIFNGCVSLEYINLENAIINSNYNYTNIFKDVPEKLIICSKDPFWSTLLEGYNSFINCNNNINIYDEFNCYKKNNLSMEYKVDICEKCGKYYYQIYNNSFNNNSLINCYKTPKKYYLDINNLFYKSCYSSCQQCDIGGNETNNNCLECDNENKYELIINDRINCYNICQYYYYVDNISNKTYCTYNLNCPDNYNKLVTNKKECIDECFKDSIYKYEYNGLCYDKCPNDTINISFICKNITNEITTEINNISSTITDFFINYMTTENIIYTSFIKTQNENLNSIEINSDYINKSDFESIKKFLLINYSNNIFNGTEIIFDKTKICLITTYNQKININENKTVIDLDKCENELKKFYNISNDNYLYILKIDINEEGMKIPKIEYELYYPLYNDKLIQLNLTICKNIKIDIYIPVNINDNIDKYNSSSDYYNNICSKTTSVFGTDISLTDRKKNFIDNNMTLCEEDCDLIDYNYTNKKAKCSCFVKINIPFLDEIKFDKDKLYKRFTDINNIANIQFMKCYKNVFNKSLKNNYGFFIYIFILFSFIICFFLFYFKFYPLLKIEIYKIIENKKRIISNDITDNKKRKLNIKEKTNTLRINKKNKRKKKIPIKKNKNSIISARKYNFKKNDDKNNSEKNNKEEEDIIDYNDSELNSLIYEKAVKLDKRTYIQYYISLLRTNHLLIFSFYCNNKDYNSQIIKIFLFFFFFAVYLAVNALFFEDSTMHQIYIDEGAFNFIYKIPIILYSTLISTFLNTIIKYLSLSQKNILEIKSEKNRAQLELKVLNVLNKLKIKFILFFIITFILLVLFLYYVTCFCGIYINTQSHLIKDSIISFGISLLYPFGIYLIPGLFRLLALKAKNKNRKCLYKFSQLIQCI